MVCETTSRSMCETTSHLDSLDGRIINTVNKTETTSQLICETSQKRFGLPRLTLAMLCRTSVDHPWGSTTNRIGVDPRLKSQPWKQVILRFGHRSSLTNVQQESCPSSQRPNFMNSVDMLPCSTFQTCSGNLVQSILDTQWCTWI